jgi:hypothetical protein
MTFEFEDVTLTLYEMLSGISDEDLDKYTYKGQPLRFWLKLFTEEKCPICGYKLSGCQCLFGGSAHPNREERIEVIKDHLYLLTPRQLEHVVNLEKHWQISYGDDEKDRIVEELKGEKT